MSKSSRLTQKYQATIPAHVRKVLNLQQGDTIGFVVEDGKVSIKKVRPY
jgi:antitoxin PrlF